jgi:hypothetical protein
LTEELEKLDSMEKIVTAQGKQLVSVVNLANNMKESKVDLATYKEEFKG